MRGIIEEYMEEMRKAGGIDDVSKGVEEVEALASENFDMLASATNDSGSRRNSEIPEDNRDRSVDYRKDVHSRQNARDCKDDNQHRRQDSRHQYPNKTTEGIQYDRDDNYETRDQRRIDNHSRVQTHGREKSNFVEAYAEDDSRRSRQRRSHRTGSIIIALEMSMNKQLMKEEEMNMTEVLVVKEKEVKTIGSLRTGREEKETELLEREMKTRVDMLIEGKAKQTGVVALDVNFMNLMTDMILQSHMTHMRMITDLCDGMHLFMSMCFTRTDCVTKACFGYIFVPGPHTHFKYGLIASKGNLDSNE